MSAGSALSIAWTAIRDQYRYGLALFVVAPVAVALVVLPEFAQHVAEIKLGMFESRTVARAMANDPTRWAFGYAKLTGLVLAFLACARAVWCWWDGGQWYDLRQLRWGRLIVGLVLFMAIGSVAAPIAPLVGRWPGMVVNTVFSILSLPALLVALAGLFGDGAPWKALVTRGWPAAVLLVLTFLTGFAPMQAIHAVDHMLALGEPTAVIWLLMIWDSLIVGALAALTGAGLAVAYRLARELAVRAPVAA